MKLNRTIPVAVTVIVLLSVTVFYLVKVAPIARPNGDLGILGRPLRVGVVSWPGYAGGIVANNGFKPNKSSVFWHNHKLLVEFVLMEDVDARSKSFVRGGEGDVDVIWTTVDFWANELPGFVRGGVDAKAFMQVDWSRGGDAIVADENIRTIEDLKGHTISLALLTPSQWLLETKLRQTKLSESQIDEIIKSVIGKSSSQDARLDFVAKRADAAVVWEPDVTEALRNRDGAHVLASTATDTYLLGDLMAARSDFIEKHPDVIQAFITGWFTGTKTAIDDPDLAAQLLFENEPVYHDIGIEETRQQLKSVKLATLEDNVEMFGLNGRQPLFDDLYTTASDTWKRRGYIDKIIPPADAKNTSFLQSIYTQTKDKK